MWKHRCTLPFHHMAVRPDGKINPCCYFRQEHVPESLNISYSDPFHHPFLEDLRRRMINDEYIEGCSKCYADEAASGTSMRTDMNNPFTEFGLPAKNRGEYTKLTNLDFAFSNVCNNKCRICGPELSTQWYSDAKKMNYGFEHRGIISTNTVIDDCDLKDLKFIKMLGGEPLMEQEKFIKLLKKCNLSELEILLVTNTTKRPNQELTDLLKKCKNINLTFSIDGYGKMNNFLRKGSDWQQVENNVKWFKETFQDCSMSFNVHSVISLYNINQVDRLVKWCQKNELNHNNVVVDGPNWIMPRNLPDSVKKELIEILIKQKKSHQSKKIFNLLIDELKQDGDFGMFIRNDINLNKIRNEHWKDLNPWLWDRIEKYITDDIL